MRKVIVMDGKALAEKCLHAKVFVESEREHLKFKISPCQLRDKFAAQKVGVGSGDEDGMSAFFTFSAVFTEHTGRRPPSTRTELVTVRMGQRIS